MASRLVAAFAALLISIPTNAPARGFGAGTRGGIVLPPEASAYGLTLGEWSAVWWKWALAAPEAVNPVLDATGVHCAVGQQGHVWFLAGSFDTAPVVRRCTIPSGRPLFFPVVNFVYVGFPGDPPITRDEIHALLAPLLAGATGLEVRVDGVAVADVSRYYVISPLFSAAAPAGAIFGIPEGPLFPCLAEGYYVMLTPLAPGRHTIAIRAELPSGFRQDVSYHLDVLAGR